MNSNIFSELNRNQLFYVACRVAFLRVFDCLLDEFISPPSSTRRPGFLERIPMFVGTAPQVQMELLFQTWQTLRSETPRPLTIQEQVICFGITSELAHTGVSEDKRMIRRAARGPVRVDAGDIVWLASRVRTLQMLLPFAPQAAVLQMESSIATDDLNPIRTAGGIDQQTFTSLLKLLGNWTINESLFANAEGLLDSAELEILQIFFEEHSNLLVTTAS